MSEYLSELDWVYLTHLIYRLNIIGDIKQLQCVFLENLRVLLPYKKAIFIYAETRDGSVQYVLPSNYSDHDVTAEDKRFISGGYDNFANIALHMGQSTVIRNSDVISNEDFEKTPLYKDIYQPQGLYYGMKLGLIRQDNLIGYIGFFNTKKDGDFSDRDVFVLDVLKDHLAFKIDRLLSTYPMNRQQERQLSSQYDFTSRELEVVKLLQAGNSCAEICETLYISESTLNKHIHHIYRKAGVKNRVQLLRALEK